jgi:ubiquinone/menaquinone biosynthesis C-methylase UbiE
MAEHQVRFDDGAAYERMMGVWSRLVGASFLDWVAPLPGLRWLDVGCGNGAFTELLVESCAPAAIDGIDPSAAQLAFARARPAGRIATFHQGDAMSLPFADDGFDAAVMALVIFFVPDPAKGAREMARVVASGGLVAAYAWDFPGGGYPLQALQDEMRAMGLKPPLPPHADVARIAALQELWARAGLVDIETRAIPVTRSFADFDEFWATSINGSSLSSITSAMPADDAARLKDRTRALYPTDSGGRVANSGWVNAVKGRAPAA